MKAGKMTLMALLILGISLVPLHSAMAGTRFWTDEEITIWQGRMVNGPYKSTGDVSSNSPGDWDRILRNGNAFKSNPTADRLTDWDNLTGCFGTNNPPRPHPGRMTTMKDAAFVYLLTGDTSYRRPILQELLFHANRPALDFTNSTLWCVNNKATDHMALTDASFLFSKQLFAYDAIRNDIGSGDRATLDAWFTGMMNHLYARIHARMNPFYTDRLNRNWSLTSSGKGQANSIIDWGNTLTHFGGFVPNKLSVIYHNPASHIMSLVGLLGIFFNDSTAILHFKTWVKEMLQFGVYADGTWGELRRWHPDHPALGWSYSSHTWSTIALPIDLLARQGDTELYTFETSNGAGGGGGTSSTSGGPKSLFRVLDHLTKYVDESLNRYGTDQAANNGNPQYLIRSYNPQTNGDRKVADVYFANTNIFRQSSQFKGIYMRTASGTPSYPSSPGGFSQIGWGGVWGILPGHLLMFGQMEDKVWPYPLPAGDSEPPRPPKGLRIQ